MTLGGVMLSSSFLLCYKFVHSFPWLERSWKKLTFIGPKVLGLLIFFLIFFLCIILWMSVVMVCVAPEFTWLPSWEHFLMAIWLICMHVSTDPWSLSRKTRHLKVMFQCDSLCMLSVSLLQAFGAILYLRGNLLYLFYTILWSEKCLVNMSHF